MNAGIKDTAILCVCDAIAGSTILEGTKLEHAGGPAFVLGGRPGCVNGIDISSHGIVEHFLPRQTIAIDIGVSIRAFRIVARVVIQAAALASQLLVEFLVLHDPSEAELIGKYLRRARTWYVEWGATSLVRHLEQTYPSYFGSI